MIKKGMIIFFCAAFLLCMLPITAQAASETAGDFVVTTDVVSGYIYSGNVLDFTSPGSYTLSMKSGISSTANDRIQIEGGTEAAPIELTLSGVEISSWASAITIINSSYVRLNLAADTTNRLTGGAVYAGITCPSAATLVIGGTGTLYAAGGCSGIGGSAGAVYDGNDGSGTIRITGGTVNATGGAYCAGIGGAGIVALNCGPVTISGGSVTATGGVGCPGIGAGFDTYANTAGTVENITISSGTVVAYGGSDAYDGGAGIGGSAYGGATVNISGGIVTATGSNGGAGIGGGNTSSGSGTITISGGDVTATGSDGGAGIGGGAYGYGGAVIIGGGTVKATGSTESSSGAGGAGIGGGCYRDSGSVTITNGDITAEGVTGGAGIGGGYSGRCGAVAISGGTVTATGSNYNTYGGAGIGDGGYGGSGTIMSSADISLTGGSIKATGGTNALNIGHGAHGVIGEPTNGDANGNKLVYLTTVTLQGAADKTAVSSLIADPGYTYGSSGMKTDASGILYLYLPAGAETTATATGSGTYTGSITTTSDPLAAGTLSLQSYIQLPTPKDLAWDATTPGKATWRAVAGASSYTVQLYMGSYAQGSAVSTSGTEYDFTSTIYDVGNGTYTFKVTAVGDGTNYHSSPASAESVYYFYSNPLITTPATLPRAAINTPYSFTFSATGTTPLTWHGVSGYIPNTLTFTSDGVLSGTPVSAYSTSFILQVANEKGTMQREFYLTIVDPATLPQLETASTLAWDGAVPGKATWSAVTNASGYSVQLYKGGVAQGSAVTVSSGLVYDFTSAIEAAGSGSYTFSVTALGDNLYYRNGASSGESGAYVYTAPEAPVITPMTLPKGKLYTAYSQTLSATGTTPIVWYITAGALPGGVTLSSSGVISGTPTASGTFNFTVEAENSVDSDFQAFSITIVDPAELPQLGTASPFAWDSAVPGKAAWSAVEHASGYSVQLYKGGVAQGSAVTVSSGLEYDFTSAIEAAGSGSYTFSVTALGDTWNYRNGVSSGQSGEYAYTAPAAPVITTATLPDGKVNTAYSETLSATGTATIEWSVTAGALPAGLTLSAAGVISGTPTISGTFNFTVQAENSEGSDTQALQIIISSYISRTLTDSTTGITVSGDGIHKDAQLTVGAVSLHSSGACDACDAIRARMADDAFTLILGKDISLSQGFTGTLTITIPVGASYNGQTVTILHCAGGTLQTLTATVTDGKAVFSVTSLSPVTIFARTELTLSSSDSDGKIYKGGRVTLTPSISGGTWDYDASLLSRSGNTFTGLKAGTTTVTYTAGQQSKSFSVTIQQSEIPATGQDFTWPWLTAAGAMLIFAAALALTFRKRAAHG